jgi:hypothetical protein
MRALQIFAGPRARSHLRERGLKAADISVIPAAAGGPKGLVLNALDRFVFGNWLPASSHTVHLLGASIGAWRMATACLPDPDLALRQLAEEYVTQEYPHKPGKQPLPRDITRIFGAALQQSLGTRAADILSHPRFRLHVFTSHGRRLLQRERRLSTAAGYAAAFAANVASRKAMGAFLERVVFSDPRTPLPFPLDDFRTRHVPLAQNNLAPSVLASCSIPFWLEAAHDIPGAPAGAYWDGGITDYHLHLDYARMTDGLVLYPHFQSTVVPGWLDKPLKYRHAATAKLDSVVLLVPNPAWVAAAMPNCKLPDRGDFKAYGEAGIRDRQRDWRKAIAEGQRLADEFAEVLALPTIDAQLLA